MTGNHLTAQEIYYLLEFRDISFLFGVPFQKPDETVMASLVQKGILSPKGEICQMTVHYVELLKKYTESSRYIHIQQYLFSLSADGLCIALKETNDTYELLVGDSLLMLQTALSHPIMKITARPYYEQITKQSAPAALTNVFLLSSPTLLMECFDKNYQLESQLAIGYQNEQFYLLDEDYQFMEVTTINPFEWLLTQVPQITEITKRILEGAEQDE
ncbi:hypothetical protein [Listeria costaricensis]|uniref:hypothetical protein n=1 Tax=Listeria costaricensis TaxID=2026604 RepID=UPI000C06F584|nr:hypothetical protein [Listeria costaricensis]